MKEFCCRPWGLHKILQDFASINFPDKLPDFPFAASNARCPALMAQTPRSDFAIPFAMIEGLSAPSRAAGDRVFRG